MRYKMKYVVFSLLLVSITSCDFSKKNKSNEPNDADERNKKNELIHSWYDQNKDFYEINSLLKELVNYNSLSKVAGYDAYTHAESLFATFTKNLKGLDDVFSDYELAIEPVNKVLIKKIHILASNSDLASLHLDLQYDDDFNSNTDKKYIYSLLSDDSDVAVVTVIYVITHKVKIKNFTLLESLITQKDNNYNAFIAEFGEKFPIAFQLGGSYLLTEKYNISHEIFSSEILKLALSFRKKVSMGIELDEQAMNWLKDVESLLTNENSWDWKGANYSTAGIDQLDGINSGLLAPVELPEAIEKIERREITISTDPVAHLIKYENF